MYPFLKIIFNIDDSMTHFSDTVKYLIRSDKKMFRAAFLTSTILCNTIPIFNTADATLFDRGGGLVYDDVLDVTWLIDANYASSTLNVSKINEIVANSTLVFSDGHQLTGTDFFIIQNGGSGDAGLMKWWGATAWADQLEYFDSVRDITYDDWRLPSVTPVSSNFDTIFSNNGTTDHGYGATTAASEMPYMFYINLENFGICTPDGNGVSTGCLMQPGWGLANTGDFLNIHTQTYWSNTELGVEVWAFDFGVGYQGLKTESNRNNQLRAWAVRDGDVIAPAIADGDLNFDGLVNAADVIIGFQILSGDVSPTSQQLLHADVAPFVGGISEPDGFIELNDITAIQRKALGIFDFP